MEAFPYPAMKFLGDLERLSACEAHHFAALEAFKRAEHDLELATEDLEREKYAFTASLQRLNDLATELSAE